MNDVIARRWRIAALVLAVVVVVLALSLLRSCSELSQYSDSRSETAPTPSPGQTDSGDGEGDGSNPAPSPTPTDDSSENEGSVDDETDDSGTGTGGRGQGNGQRSGGVNGSGSGTGQSGDLRAFRVVGNVPGALEPGLGASIDLKFTNPNGRAIRITSVTATIDSLDAPFSTPTLPCTASDYAITQLSGAASITVPARSTRTLSQLGVPQSEWPEFRMRNTALDQDGCKGATITIDYAAKARTTP